MHLIEKSETFFASCRKNDLVITLCRINEKQFFLSGQKQVILFRISKKSESLSAICLKNGNVFGSFLKTRRKYYILLENLKKLMQIPYKTDTFFLFW